MEWKDVTALLIPATGYLGWRLARRKANREEDLSYRAENAELREERRQHLAELRSLSDRVGALEEQLREALKEAAFWRRVVPFEALSRSFSDEASAERWRWILNRSGCLWFITSPLQRGLLLWCSDAWERLLGCSKADLLGAGWRTFLHPDLVAKTDRIEASAWREDVDGECNTFVGQDGAEHELRWYALAYQGGWTLAVAIEEGAAAKTLMQRRTTT